MAQHAGIGRIESVRAPQIFDGPRVTPGGLQQAAGMKCEFKGVGGEVGRSPAMDYGAIEPPCCGEGAAGVTVSFCPLGPQHQHPLVGCCRLFMSPAITEYPGAQIRDFVALGLQIERGAGAFDRLANALPVVQSLAQAAIKPCSFVVGEIATLETKAAFLDLARSSRGYRHLTNFTSVAQPGGTLDGVGRPRLTYGRAGSRGPGRDRGGVGPAHPPPACLAGFTSR